MGAACCSEIDKATPSWNGLQPAGMNKSPRGLGEKTPLLPSDATKNLENGQHKPSPISVTATENNFFPQAKLEPKAVPGEDDTMSQASEGTSISNVTDVAEKAASKQQKEQAKAVIKDFVKIMVKGRRINVVAQNGSVRECTVFLNRSLDTLKLKVNKNTRNISLKTIEEIFAGDGLEGIQTPLDELCATLMLSSEDCITFRLGDMNERDTFIMCLHMFCNNQD